VTNDCQSVVKLYNILYKIVNIKVIAVIMSPMGTGISQTDVMNSDMA